MHQIHVPALLRFSVVAALLFSSCKKSSTNNTNNPPTPNTVKDIYIAGSAINSSGKNVALYWKNGNPVQLSNGSRDAVASSIFVSGGKVYAAGYQDKSGSVLNVATYWVDGVAYALGSAGGTHDRAASIVVANNVEHIAGWERNHSTGNDMAKYWSNGAAVSLTNGSREGRATGVFVSGSDVYVCGFEEDNGGDNVAMYWKNGVPVLLSDGSTDAEALCIYVNGNDVYVGGSQTDASNGHNQAVYWKNGALQNLTIASNQASVNAITVANGVVYAAGIDISAFTYAVLWQNGAQSSFLPPANMITGPAGGMGGVAVNGTGIYLCGQLASTGSSAMYWKKGSPDEVVILPNPAAGWAGASGIFLTYE